MMKTDRSLTHAFSISCAAALLLAGAGSCQAATPMQAVLACRRIAQPSRRLECFDRASARLAASLAAAHPASDAPVARTAPAESAAPAAAVAAARPAAAPAPAVKRLSAEQAFGLSDSALTAHEVAVGALPKPISRITATLRRITTAADGRWVFTLSNGQVWVQDYRNHQLLVSRGQRVSISRQLFGSYWMQLPDDTGCKVERVR